MSRDHVPCASPLWWPASHPETQFQSFGMARAFGQSPQANVAQRGAGIPTGDAKGSQRLLLPPDRKTVPLGLQVQDRLVVQPGPDRLLCHTQTDVVPLVAAVRLVGGRVILDGR